VKAPILTVPACGVMVMPGLSSVTMNLRPRGLMKLLEPIMRGSFQRNEVKNLANIKEQME